MARWIVFALALGSVAAAHAGTFATHVSRDGTVISLMTEPCMVGARKLLKYAQKRSGEQVQEGCWSVNKYDNPVVLWDDGRAEEVNRRWIRLEARYDGVLKQIDELAAGDGPQPKPVAAAEGVQRAAFARPDWCREARQPHEQAICHDRDLSAADLRLAPLWRSYRSEMNLNEAEQQRMKSDFARRLRACGSDRACIANEQSARIKFYQQALRADAAR